MPTVGEIAEFLSATCRVRLRDEAARVEEVTGAAPFDEARHGALTFTKAGGAKAAVGFEKLEASVVVIGAVDDLDALPLRGVACLASSEDPRLDFIRAVTAFFVPEPPKGVHPGAVVSPKASIAADVYIGPGCTIGAAVIGAGCVIHGGVHVHDGVTLGERAIVHSGAVIGADGFGFARDESGVPAKFPHLGCIVIGDDVEIGANSCIDRATLGETVIEDSVKIDNLVHVAHNTRLGAGTMIAAGAVIGGSSTLGRRVWVGPGAVISNKLTVGNDAFVTLGAVVTRDVADGQKVTGNFAVEHERFLRFLKTIR